MAGTSIPAIVKKHKIKWWGSFKNTTTEIVVKERILKKAQFPTVSYAGKLTLQQGEPSFGAQKAQCQALLAAAKTPEEFKIICQQMFKQLTPEEKEKVKQSCDKESSKESSDKESSRKSSSKKISKRQSKKKIKKQSSSESESTASSQTSSSSKNQTSSYCDSNEDDCYGVLPPVKIKSKTGKRRDKQKAKVKKEKKGKLKKGKKKKDTTSSESE
ncbi:uncharacterized protein LOC110607717 [Manihot esculenta]|uniref:uncharacterized protein LOC110607717 n=1 Tax=Manihot esculenta TaxID=3983 RepID=UPI000B5D220D|nr:uncharacterized protein LOC110607717 [Manihot esculenta]